MIIRIRDDDVFRIGCGYDSYHQVVERFKEIHKIIADEGALHIAALVCGTLDWFPGGIHFLVQAYKKGELLPEIHGWDHICYGNLPKVEVIDHLKRCIDAINQYFEYNPKKFYTPWGSSDSHIKEATEFLGLEMIDCSNILYPKRKFFGGKAWESYSKVVREGRQELFIHWYENKWFKQSNTHSLVKTIRTIKNNDPSFWVDEKI